MNVARAGSFWSSNFCSFSTHESTMPFFILTENNDPATEYEYRHEGVNDYITAPVNIPELIRQVLFFVE